MVEQKSRVEVRNRIRREFEAMVRREREMRQKVVRQVRMLNDEFRQLIDDVTGKTCCQVGAGGG